MKDKMPCTVIERRSPWRPFGRADEKKVVPWFSMSEWKSVRDLLYSELTTDHKVGYNRLCGWKARCPDSLPAPVECTLSIFHVLLGDPDYLTPRATTLSREEELRLMYSTAVMRFLNLMLGAHNEDLSGTMYNRASMRNIPEWLVNLRHDAAHGKSLPELSLLRGASLFIRKWLFEYYWEDGNQETTDWIVSGEEVSSPSDIVKEVHNIVETWEALSIFKISGFNNLSQIPYNDLRSSIELIQKLQQSVEENEHVGPRASFKKPAKVSSALILIESKLKNFMSKNLHSIEIQDALCDTLVNGDLLLPSENLLKVMDLDGELDLGNMQSLPTVLEEHWAGMMYTLWETESIPYLIKRLITVSLDRQTTNLQGNLAALWGQKLILSCIKVREARKVHCAIMKENKLDEVFSTYKESLHESNRKEVIASVSLGAVEKQREDLKRAYSWKLLPIPESVLSMDLVKLALATPPPDWCRLYLPHLFDLVTPPIPATIQLRLMELITICNDGQLQLAEENEETLYSVSDLLSKGDTSTCSVNESVSHGDRVHNPWKLSQEHLEWGSSPLGLLPWQQKQQHHDMEEFERRQQQRTWSRLSVDGNWKVNAPSENGMSDSDCSFETPKANNQPRDKLRVIQNGRVSKPKLYTPKQFKIKVFRNLSPNIAQLLQKC